MTAIMVTAPVALDQTSRNGIYESHESEDDPEASSNTEVSQAGRSSEQVKIRGHSAGGRNTGEARAGTSDDSEKEQGGSEDSHNRNNSNDVDDDEEEDEEEGEDEEDELSADHSKPRSRHMESKTRQRDEDIQSGLEESGPAEEEDSSESEGEVISGDGSDSNVGSEVEARWDAASEAAATNASADVQSRNNCM